MLETSMSVCRRGHMLSPSTEKSGIFGVVGAHCPTCGAVVTNQCSNCHEAIPGMQWDERPGVTYSIDFDESMATWAEKVPKFCHGCGKAYPWAGRAEQLFELENRLIEEVDLSESEQLLLVERMALLHEHPSVREEEEIWEHLSISVGTRFAPIASRVASGLLTAKIRAAIGLQVNLARLLAECVALLMVCKWQVAASTQLQRCPAKSISLDS